MAKKDFDTSRRGPDPGPDLHGPDAGAWMIIFAFGVGVVITLSVWLGGTLAGYLSGVTDEGPSFGIQMFFDLFKGGPAALWPSLDPVVVYICVGGVSVLTTAILVGCWHLWGNWRGGLRKGLAGRQELFRFTLEERAKEAVRLRPKSLEGVKPSQLHPNDVGPPLGAWNGKKLYSGWEDVSLAIMAPRSGKTSSLGVPQILAAPGSVIVTSNKADIYAITAEKRKRDHPDARIWAFDPQQVVQAEPNWYWNALGHVNDFDTALELALMFVARREADDSGGGNSEFFQSAGRNYLAYLFLAAALPTKNSPPATLREVDKWLDTSDPLDAVFRLQASGQINHAKALKAMVDGPPETVGGIIATARDAAVALKSEKIIRWVSPGEGRDHFDVEAFVHSEDTLYLMSNEKSASAAAPLIAAFASRIFDVSAEQASRQYRQRLDPPMVAVLDEAANICKIPGLPNGYSHYGSRGLCVMSIFQNSHQPVRVWGKNAWQEMWSAATIKLIGPGIDDPNFAEELSKLVGQVDQDVSTLSHSKQSGHNYSVTVRQESVLSASQIRTIDKTKMLLLATATKPALIDQVRYYQGEHSEELARDEKKMADLITTRSRLAVEADNELTPLKVAEPEPAPVAEPEPVKKPVGKVPPNPPGFSPVSSAAGGVATDQLQDNSVDLDINSDKNDDTGEFFLGGLHG